MQNYTEKKILGIDCYVNSELAEAMAADKMTNYFVECEIEALRKEIDPNDINFETGEFKTETGFIKVFGQVMRFSIEGEVAFDSKDEEGNPESWHLNEEVRLQIRRVR